MARALRIKYKNALYHITSRGNERRNIFADDPDRDFFLKTLKESLNTYHVILYSYVLMSNHFYLLLETPHWNELIDMNQLKFYYHDALGAVEDENGKIATMFTDPDKLEKELISIAPEDRIEKRVQSKWG